MCTSNVSNWCCRTNMPGLLWDYFDKSINWFLLFATKEYSTSYKQTCSMDRNFHPNVELFVTFWWRRRLTVQMISEWKLYGYGPDTVDFLYLYTSATVRTYKSVHYIIYVIRIRYGYRGYSIVVHVCYREAVQNLYIGPRDALLIRLQVQTTLSLFSRQCCGSGF